MTTTTPAELGAARERLLALVGDLRPELHRYCARLVGSAIDGEDVVQETLAKALYALSLSPEIPPLRPWLFRIAHNTAIDFLRRYDRRFVEPMAEVPEPAVEPPPDPDSVRAALSSFLTLPVSQRSAVILKDVLGQSLEDIATATNTTVAAVKASLFRGRANLAAQGHKDPTAWRDRPETSAADRTLLSRYSSLFNARDWDGVRAMLVEECRLDLVGKTTRRGKGVENYFTNLDKDPSQRWVLGRAEGRLVLGIFRGDKPHPDTIVAVDFTGDRIAQIRDYRYVPYLTAELDFVPEENS
jgi:RNA polymerase sigma-70 factor (ECF subfamily)